MEFRFENNHYYAGTTAVIYNLEVDHSNSIGMQLTSDGQLQFPADTRVKILGFKYGKGAALNTYILAGPDDIAAVTAPNKAASFTDGSVAITNGIYTVPTVDQYSRTVPPFVIVVKNLEPDTDYVFQSFWSDGIETVVFNDCTIRTKAVQDVTYKCTEVTGGTDAQNAKIQSVLDDACAIINSMTAFTRANSNSDFLNSKAGGSFTATVVEGMEGWADSTMRFSPNCPVHAAVHEMAHNIMFPSIDGSSTSGGDKIVKFMEFATYSPNADWRWMGAHNYPVISSAQYREVGNHLVAAGCYVCRDAGGLI